MKRLFMALVVIMVLLGGNVWAEHFTAKDEQGTPLVTHKVWLSDGSSDWWCSLANLLTLGGSANILQPYSANLTGLASAYNAGTGALTITGTVTAGAYDVSASASPGVTFLDSNAPGTDKEIGKIIGDYIDGADGSENGTVDLKVHEAGTSTSYMQLDGKNVVIDAFRDINLASGKVYKINGTNLKDVDQDIWQCFSVGGWGLDADGTNCAATTSAVLNSGPKVPYSLCTDAAGTVDFNYVMPWNWDGGNVVTFIAATSLEASPSGTVEFDVSLMARGIGDTINSTWVTTNGEVYFNDAVTAGTTIDTQYGEFIAYTTTAMAAAGAGGDTLYVRITRDNDDGTYDTSTQSVPIKGVMVCYQIDDMDEKD